MDSHKLKTLMHKLELQFEKTRSELLTPHVDVDKVSEALMLRIKQTCSDIELDLTITKLKSEDEDND